MDGSQFDRLTRIFTERASRRNVMGSVFGGALATILGTAEPADAARRRRRRRNSRPRRQRCRRIGQVCGGPGLPGCGRCCSRCIKARPSGQRECACCPVDAVCERANDCCSKRCQGRRCRPPLGFEICTIGGATVDYVRGPKSPPVGSGSAQFTVSAAGATDEGFLRSSEFSGTLLSQLQVLRYATYVQTTANCGPSGQAPYIVLRVAAAGGAEPDDILVFEPVYVDNGPDITCGAWQEWDALAANARWWSISDPNTFIPLSTYIAANPQATIRDVTTDAACPTVRGGFRIEAGFGVPWNNFIGNVDYIQVKVAGQKVRTFDF